MRPLGEAELAALDDDELIAYAVSQREAGDETGARLALRIFAFGMEAPVLSYVRTRLDSHGDSTIEEVAERALEDAIRSIADLRGRTAPEARAFVFRIAKMRIVDFHRKGRVETTPLEELVAEGDSGPVPGSMKSGAEDGFVVTSILVEEALAELRPDHRAVVELFVLSDCPARKAASIVQRRFPEANDDPMSEQNVHQIGSRFRKDLRARLEQAERGAVGS